ncbi:uncharacterized protein BDW43DRAFT_68602 [Aspergillus alliaceus]|uniref:uncharacterized protein n=1 Tax=Petromyces alliaceus TaxID=209559 RepID=UPI0012A65F58|nr:uncharacterized protein BDW43DRAFT_68602 [Aspergillus alliaceus]KAB8238779.1 hypothetical protein BDW43DRAFT_68602 [Aspergillus alliaceus]
MASILLLRNRGRTGAGAQKNPQVGADQDPLSLVMKSHALLRFRILFLFVTSATVVPRRLRRKDSVDSGPTR